jgi:hypothetical protein
VFENRVLRRIFGPKGEEVTGEWRKHHNEEHHDLYSSPTILRVITFGRIRWVGHVAQMVERRGVYRVLVGNLKCRWENNIKMDVQEMGCGDMNWVELAQYRDR